MILAPLFLSVFIHQTSTFLMIHAVKKDHQGKNVKNKRNQSNDAMIPFLKDLRELFVVTKAL